MLKWIFKTNHDKELQTVTDCYGNDLNKDMLRLYLETLPANNTQRNCDLFEVTATFIKHTFVRGFYNSKTISGHACYKFCK